MNHAIRPIALAALLFALLPRPATAQLNLRGIFREARQVINPPRGNRPRIIRQIENAAVEEIERRAPEVGRIIRRATGGGHRTLPYPPPERVVPRPGTGTTPGRSGGTKRQPEVNLDELPEIFAGDEIALEGENLGTKAGRVLVRFKGLVLKSKIKSWEDAVTVVVLPKIELEKPALAAIEIVMPSGKVVQQLPVKFSPAAEAPPKEEPASELPVVTVGEELALDGEQLGNKEGIVTLSIGGLKVKAKIVAWTNDGVTLVVPNLDLDEATQAKLEVKRADGQVASAFDVQLAPAAAAKAAK